MDIKNIRIALAGNPNSGKTTLFNALTGSSQYVGNWPGVTVEKKEGKLKNQKNVTIVDLPGIYSLSPYSLEEVITRDYLLEDKPEVILNIVDASNLERNLYLTTQLFEMGIPVVIALNMMDVVTKSGDKLDSKKLEKALGVPVVEMSASKNTGVFDAAIKAVESASLPAPTPFSFSADVDKTLDEIVKSSGKVIPKNLTRWYSVKLFERDEKAMNHLNIPKNIVEKIDTLTKIAELEQDDDSESIITNERYNVVASVITKSTYKRHVGVTTSEKIDNIVTNRWLALPIFVIIMFLVYFVAMNSVGLLITDWTNDVLFGEHISNGASFVLEKINAAPWLEGLVVDGLIGGVGAVLGFVPQMLILFLFLAFLEDCGYMARVAFIMDRIFRKFGLSGKSFIPMLIASGCGVPGIMASRTIESEKDRRMTVMTTTFIPCGAKLPIIALIGSSFFSSWKIPLGPFVLRGSTLIAVGMYFVGIAMVILSGIILKKTKMFAGKPTPFVMELPAYHMPSVKSMLFHMWDRAKHFIIKAGTVIFIASGLIWFLSNFSWSMQMVEQDASMLASLGNFIAPLFAPLGFGNWQSSVATVSGLIAKENVVGTFGVLLGLGRDVGEGDPALQTQLALLFGNGVVAFSFMLFNMLCAPCFAAIGAIRREMNSFRWTMFAVAYQTALAYIVAFLFYQFASLASGYISFGVGSVIAIILLIVVVFLIFRPDSNKSRPTNLAPAN